jgi:hypothetical protein
MNRSSVNNKQKFLMKEKIRERERERGRNNNVYNDNKQKEGNK